MMFAMAFAEGANDISKVAATLIGGGITSYSNVIYDSLYKLLMHYSYYYKRENDNNLRLIHDNTLK